MRPDKPSRELVENRLCCGCYQWLPRDRFQRDSYFCHECAEDGLGFGPNETKFSPRLPGGEVLR